jgi:hypothetical protein
VVGMAEASVFVAYQVQRALRGHLAEDDAMQMLARDDATGVFWVLTRRELVLVKNMQIEDRLPRAELTGDVEVTDVTVTVRVRTADRSKVVMGTFRKRNRLTEALAEIVDAPPR